MTSQVETIGPKMQLADIITFLLEHKRSSAPVVDDQDVKRRLLGFVSEGDCLEYVGNELFYGNPSPPQTAETIMRKHPTCVGPETDLFTLTSIFTSHRFHHLPVVQDGNLIGIVSRRDVLKAIDVYYRDWNRTRDRERFPVDIHEIMNHRFIVGH
ncbi:CBS domain-containing protein [Aporhodopirellula aestuarii]|uniref:CBS domain-containing protein n=1 Tax=Aporhodopirellula aestuarii TaxID=2950107 RepID=A0ABT0TYB9_9BACT|nr:CBS domain-containing protein [Aporhodopirellula aestuarii]MCM2369476.1 CBS domain-containing protein [Aporhodopirellula aestuarii]